jgi:hypothetical protein
MPGGAPVEEHRPLGELHLVIGLVDPRRPMPHVAVRSRVRCRCHAVARAEVRADGGDGTFGNELMSSAIGIIGNPISRLTVACIIDLGHQVDLEATRPIRALPTDKDAVALTAPTRLRGHFIRPEIQHVANEGAWGK